MVQQDSTGEWYQKTKNRVTTPIFHKKMRKRWYEKHFKGNDFPFPIK